MLIGIFLILDISWNTEIMMMMIMKINNNNNSGQH